MRACTALLISAVVAGCGAEAPTNEPPPFTGDGELSIVLAPLNLGEAVGDAFFSLKVFDADHHLVWQVARISADDDGFNYVGPCDASARPYTVELVLLELRNQQDEIIPPSSYYNPTSAANPLVRTVACEHGATFDMDLARDEHEGFFDFGVKFDEVFCSAKVDCKDSGGNPLKLLFPDGGTQRGETAVFGLACASSHGATWLYLDQLVVECANELAILDPGGPEGNAGPQGDALFQTAVYVGSQTSEGDQVCYWNAALGMNLGENMQSCTLHTRATATNKLWPGGLTPAGKIYPYIDVDVPLTNGAGELLCGHHPIANGGPVTIQYTDGQAQMGFDHARACGFQTVPFPRDIECEGTINGDDVTFTDQGSGEFVVQFGDDVLATPMTLPLGTALQSCCGNPCCSE